MSRRKVTTEEFIERAKSVHGNKYNYSLVQYTGALDKVKIICPMHGVFEIVANHHLRGDACPLCGKIHHLTKDIFIERARNVHSDKYSYDKVIYVNNKNHVIITCPEHGDFLQTPFGHLKGNGCPKCSGRNRNTDDFVKIAKEVHGERYNYSKTIYVNALSKVEIICHQHGSFWQEANSHLQGCGCPICSAENMGRNKSNTEYFIKRAVEIHGNRYDYSKTNYIGSEQRVCITCKEHGDFYQIASNHLCGANCPECSKKESSDKLRMSTHEFVERANAIHGWKYDYSKVEYINTKTKVCIICPNHGDFWQLPSAHLKGHGCSKCKKSLGEQQIIKVLDFYNVDYEQQKKIPNTSLFCNNRYIYVDFYIPKYNLIIEYQGEQHYKPIKWFGGVTQFEKQKERDNAVRQYCKDNNIKLLEIRYSKNHNVSKIIKKELNL